MPRPKYATNRPKKVATSVTLDPQIKHELDARALREGVSASSLLERILRKVFVGG